MSYKSATGKTIDAAFAEFHAANPHIYHLFQNQVFRAINSGRKKVSSKAIINWIRWEKSIETSSRGYKINDAFTSRYARLFIELNPHLENVTALFNMRELRSTGPTIKETY